MGPSYESAMGPSYASALSFLHNSRESDPGHRANRENAFTTLARNARIVQWDQCLKKRRLSCTVAGDEPVVEVPRSPSANQVERHRIEDLARFDNPNADNSGFPYQRPANFQIAAWE